MYCTKPRRFNGKFACSLYVKYLEYVLCITMFVCMYVCMEFEYNVGIQRRRKRKGNFGDAPGVLAEQFRVRIAESRLVAGNFPWLMTAFSFSLSWGFFAFVFAAFLAFFCLPHPTSRFLEN